VVTYQPAAYLRDNLDALARQSATLFVIDNGSENAAEVESLTHTAGGTLIKNSTNLGIAAALSQAARAALDGGYAWLATFDQDSRLAPGTIQALLDLRERHPQRERIGIVAPSHRDRGAGRDYHLPFDVIEEGPDWRIVRTTITSGSLISTEVFRRIGLFDDALFIDAVDHDFCLRCRRAGFLILEGKHQVLEHSLGDVVAKRVLGLPVMFTNHSPTRRYYMTRNPLAVYGRYLGFDPIWSLRGYAHLLVSTVLVLLYERERRAKLKAVLDGVRDFARRRFGPRPAA